MTEYHDSIVTQGALLGMVKTRSEFLEQCGQSAPVSFTWAEDGNHNTLRSGFSDCIVTKGVGMTYENS